MHPHISSIRGSVHLLVHPSVTRIFKTRKKRVILTSEVEVMSRGGKRRKEGYGVVGEGMMRGMGRG